MKADARVAPCAPRVPNGRKSCSGWHFIPVVILALASFRAIALPPPQEATRLLLKTKKQVDEMAIQNLFHSHGAIQERFIAGAEVRVLQVRPAFMASALSAFRSHKLVEFAEVDHALPPALIPNDPGFVYQWHLTNMTAQAAWDMTLGSTNVLIAILDTGVESTHPDLAENLVPGWNTYDNNSDTSDVYGHGTEVAGTAAAVANNGFGVSSVAPNCRIM